ncbi:MULTISPECIES: hypothetical protein [Brevundimonas]|uniref:hypothetical protein n=1 Tax=Brevundimonas sp. 357 TaxID=2555782 RepID=UPI000F77A2DD|nr:MULTISPECIES: hypothetical protein [Brevundimonas]
MFGLTERRERRGLCVLLPNPDLSAALCAPYAATGFPHGPFTPVRGLLRFLVELEVFGMADVIFVVIGVGAFVAFAALAIVLRRL